jgi:hypothetical protein
VKRPLLGLAIAIGALATAAPAALAAAAPTTVRVRVEGARATLVATTVRTTTTPVIKDADPAHSCDGTSGAGALQLATDGRWSGTWSDGLGYSVDAVRGERHAFGSGAFWSIYVNEVPASTGLCGIEPRRGDRLLLAPAPERGDPPAPLVLTAPPRARAGRPFRVRVTAVATTFDANFNATTTRRPVAGAIVRGRGVRARTGANGVATIRLRRGTTTLRASRRGAIRSATRTVRVAGAPVPSFTG